MSKSFASLLIGLSAVAKGHSQAEELFTARELEHTPLHEGYPRVPLHLHAAEPDHLSAYERLTHSERQRKLDYLQSVGFKGAAPAHQEQDTAAQLHEMAKSKPRGQRANGLDDTVQEKKQRKKKKNADQHQNSRYSRHHAHHRRAASFYDYDEELPPIEEDEYSDSYQARRQHRRREQAPISTSRHHQSRHHRRHHLEDQDEESDYLDSEGTYEFTDDLEDDRDFQEEMEIEEQRIFAEQKAKARAERTYAATKAQPILEDEQIDMEDIEDEEDDIEDEEYVRDPRRSRRHRRRQRTVSEDDELEHLRDQEAQKRERTDYQRKREDELLKIQEEEDKAIREAADERRKRKEERMKKLEEDRKAELDAREEAQKEHDERVRARQEREERRQAKLEKQAEKQRKRIEKAQRKAQADADLEEALAAAEEEVEEPEKEENDESELEEKPEEEETDDEEQEGDTDEEQNADDFGEDLFDSEFNGQISLDEEKRRTKEAKRQQKRRAHKTQKNVLDRLIPSSKNKNALNDEFLIVPSYKREKQPTGVPASKKSKKRSQVPLKQQAQRRNPPPHFDDLVSVSSTISSPSSTPSSSSSVSSMTTIRSSEERRLEILQAQLASNLEKLDMLSKQSSPSLNLSETMSSESSENEILPNAQKKKKGGKSKAKKDKETQKKKKGKGKKKDDDDDQEENQKSEPKKQVSPKKKASEKAQKDAPEHPKVEEPADEFDQEFRYIRPGLVEFEIPSSVPYEQADFFPSNPQMRGKQKNTEQQKQKSAQDNLDEPIFTLDENYGDQQQAIKEHHSHHAPHISYHGMQIGQDSEEENQHHFQAHQQIGVMPPHAYHQSGEHTRKLALKRRVEEEKQAKRSAHQNRRPKSVPSKRRIDYHHDIVDDGEYYYPLHDHEHYYGDMGSEMQFYTPQEIEYEPAILPTRNLPHHPEDHRSLHVEPALSFEDFPENDMGQFGKHFGEDIFQTGQNEPMYDEATIKSLLAEQEQTFLEFAQENTHLTKKAQKHESVARTAKKEATLAQERAIIAEKQLEEAMRRTMELELLAQEQELRSAELEAKAREAEDAMKLLEERQKKAYEMPAPSQSEKKQVEEALERERQYLRAQQEAADQELAYYRATHNAKQNEELAKEIKELTRETEKEIGAEAHHLAKKAKKQEPLKPEIAYLKPSPTQNPNPNPNPTLHPNPTPAQPKPLSVPKHERGIPVQNPSHSQAEQPNVTDETLAVPAKEKSRFDPSQLKLPKLTLPAEEPAKDQLAMIKSLQKFDQQKKKGASMAHMAELARAKYKSAEVAEEAKQNALKRSPWMMNLMTEHIDLFEDEMEDYANFHYHTGQVWQNDDDQIEETDDEDSEEDDQQMEQADQESEEDDSENELEEGSDGDEEEEDEDLDDEDDEDGIDLYESMYERGGLSLEPRQYHHEEAQNRSLMRFSNKGKIKAPFKLGKSKFKAPKLKTDGSYSEMVMMHQQKVQEMELQHNVDKSAMYNQYQSQVQDITNQYQQKLTALQNDYETKQAQLGLEQEMIQQQLADAQAAFDKAQEDLQQAEVGNQPGMYNPMMQGQMGLAGMQQDLTSAQYMTADFGGGASEYAPIPPVQGGYYSQPISMQQMGFSANSYDMGPFDEQMEENRFDPNNYQQVAAANPNNPIVSQMESFLQRYPTTFGNVQRQTSPLQPQQQQPQQQSQFYNPQVSPFDETAFEQSQGQGWGMEGNMHVKEQVPLYQDRALIMDPDSLHLEPATFDDPVDLRFGNDLKKRTLMNLATKPSRKSKTPRRRAHAQTPIDEDDPLADLRQRERDLLNDKEMKEAELKADYEARLAEFEQDYEVRESELEQQKLEFEKRLIQERQMELEYEQEEHLAHKTPAKRSRQRRTTKKSTKRATAPKKKTQKKKSKKVPKSRQQYYGNSEESFSSSVSSPVDNVSDSVSSSSYSSSQSDISFNSDENKLANRPTHEKPIQVPQQAPQNHRSQSDYYLDHLHSESIEDLKMQGDPFEVDWDLGLKLPKEHTPANGKGKSKGKKSRNSRRNNMDVSLNLAQIDEEELDNDLSVYKKGKDHHVDMDKDHKSHHKGMEIFKKGKDHHVEMKHNELATESNSEEHKDMVVPPGHYVDAHGFVKKLPEGLAEHLSENEMHLRGFPSIDINEYLLNKEKQHISDQPDLYPKVHPIIDEKPAFEHHKAQTESFDSPVSESLRQFIKLGLVEDTEIGHPELRQQAKPFNIRPKQAEQLPKKATLPSVGDVDITRILKKRDQKHKEFVQKTKIDPILPSVLEENAQFDHSQVLQPPSEMAAEQIQYDFNKKSEAQKAQQPKSEAKVDPVPFAQQYQQPVFNPMAAVHPAHQHLQTPLYAPHQPPKTYGFQTPYAYATTPQVVPLQQQQKPMTPTTPPQVTNPQAYSQFAARHMPDFSKLPLQEQAAWLDLIRNIQMVEAQQLGAKYDYLSAMTPSVEAQNQMSDGYDNYNTAFATTSNSEYANYQPMSPEDYQNLLKLRVPAERATLDQSVGNLYHLHENPQHEYWIHGRRYIVDPSPHQIQFGPSQHTQFTPTIVPSDPFYLDDQLQQPEDPFFIEEQNRESLLKHVEDVPMPSEFDPAWLKETRVHSQGHLVLPEDLHIAASEDPLARPMEETLEMAELAHTVPHVTKQPIKSVEQQIIEEVTHEEDMPTQVVKSTAHTSSDEPNHHSEEIATKEAEDEDDTSEASQTPEYVQAVSRIIEQSQREREVKEKHKAEKEAHHAKDKKAKENHAAAMRAQKDKAKKAQMKKSLPKLDQNGLYEDAYNYDFPNFVEENPLVEYFDPTGSIVTTIGGSEGHIHTQTDDYGSTRHSQGRKDPHVHTLDGNPHHLRTKHHKEPTAHHHDSEVSFVASLDHPESHYGSSKIQHEKKKPSAKESGHYSLRSAPKTAQKAPLTAAQKQSLQQFAQEFGSSFATGQIDEYVHSQQQLQQPLPPTHHQVYRQPVPLEHHKQPVTMRHDVAGKKGKHQERAHQFSEQEFERAIDGLFGQITHEVDQDLAAHLFASSNHQQHSLPTVSHNLFLDSSSTETEEHLTNGNKGGNGQGESEKANPKYAHKDLALAHLLQ